MPFIGSGMDLLLFYASTQRTMKDSFLKVTNLVNIFNVAYLHSWLLEVNHSERKDHTIQYSITMSAFCPSIFSTNIPNSHQ